MPKKKLVQYGAGNIGRGFIGDLFARAEYKIVFIDVQTEIVDAINRFRAYPVRYVSDESYEEIMVKGVRAIHGQDIHNVAKQIASADIMATAVGVSVLPHIIKSIIAGLRLRWFGRNNYTPLNIIICENKLDAGTYLKELLLKELKETEKTVFKETVGLVEASIGRMVPIMTNEMRGDNPLRVCVEAYAELPVDGNAIKGSVPEIDGLIPSGEFPFYIRRKLFIHNLGHAVTAYLGWYKNLKYISDAIRDPFVREYAEGAMKQAAAALSVEYDYPADKIINHVNDLIRRFHNRALGDTTERVGRDPIRKLAFDDRLSGAALFCFERGLPCKNICAGIAAGLLYENSDDPASFEVQKEIKEKGIEKAIEKICGIKSDSEIGKQIIAFYNKFKLNPH